MRKPTPSEFRLLGIFGLVLFLVLNVVVARWYLGERQTALAQIIRLEQSVADYRALLSERPHWEARRAWMQKNPPDAHFGQESDSQFAGEIQRSLTEQGLTIEDQQLREARRDGGLVESQMEFSGKGNIEQFVRWLNQVQQPGNHLIVRSLALRRLDERETMIARIQVAKIFRADAHAAVP